MVLRNIVWSAFYVNEIKHVALLLLRVVGFQEYYVPTFNNNHYISESQKACNKIFIGRLDQFISRELNNNYKKEEKRSNENISLISIK